MTLNLSRRLVKGAPLSAEEHDANLDELEGGITGNEAAIDAHVAAGDPHPAYALEADLGGAALLDVGTSAGTVAAGDDPRLSNSRTPTGHRSTHAQGGSDALTPADIGAEPAGSALLAFREHVADVDPHPGYVLESDLGNSANLDVGTSAGTVAAGDDPRLSNSRTPTGHRSTHAQGGSDALTPADIGAEPVGAAASAVAAHAQTYAPHPDYVLNTTFNTRLQEVLQQAAGTASVVTTAAVTLPAGSTGPVAVSLADSAFLGVETSIKGLLGTVYGVLARAADGSYSFTSEQTYTGSVALGAGTVFAAAHLPNTLNPLRVGDAELEENASYQDYPGHGYVIVDQAGRIALAIRQDGTIYAPSLYVEKFGAPGGNIDIDSIDTGLLNITGAGAFESALHKYTEFYSYAFVDNLGRVAWGVQPDGTLAASKIKVEALEISGTVETLAASKIKVEALEISGTVASLASSTVNAVFQSYGFPDGSVQETNANYEDFYAYAFTGTAGEVSFAVLPNGQLYVPSAKIDKIEGYSANSIAHTLFGIYESRSVGAEQNIFRFYQGDEIQLTSGLGAKNYNLSITQERPERILFYSTRLGSETPFVMDVDGERQGPAKHAKDLIMYGDSMTQGIGADVKDGQILSIADMIGDGRNIVYAGIGGQNATQIAARYGAFNAKKYTPIYATTTAQALSFAAGLEGNSDKPIALNDSGYLPIGGSQNILVADGSLRVFGLLFRIADGTYRLNTCHSFSVPVTLAAGAEIVPVFSQGHISGQIQPGVPKQFEQAANPGYTSLWPVPQSQSAQKVEVFFDGVDASLKGELNYTFANNVGTATFTPYADQLSLTVPSQSVAKIKWLTSDLGQTLVLWLGRNGVEIQNSPHPYNLNDVECYIAFVNQIAQVYPKFLILSHFNGGASDESDGDAAIPTVSSAKYQSIIARNQQIAEAFPSNYYDLRADFIAGSKAWLEASHPDVFASDWGQSFYPSRTGNNLGPDSDWDVANDVVPRAMREDTVHLNRYGSEYASVLIAARLQSLQW